ncbi:hypothetical protein KSF_012200 [Reticulibacter mediterranei]|uniref:Glycosyltransferase RgtA/B/C/D-like domain-containing protein n=1 Tax=Reticulibacter mediterranei TaxID=2778369 RepID=A0A8J3N1C0_9CHLR|nr:hypothetical protein [Reticulibacter mediterranei]GHO91172.1 hypothetical protein KSF_012200 [Reticulibacter mediterranei]
MLRWGEIRAKYLHANSYGLWAGALIVLAVALRVALIALGWPQLDSDEGTMGIMGMHILSQGEHPVFFYAQGYMGALEAYVAAAFFALFGVSTFTLRIGLVVFFALFLVGMYLLTSRLYTRPWALVTLAFLSLGSAPILARQLVAIGGYAETLLFGVCLLVLSVWLAFSSTPDFSNRHHWKRLTGYAAWGVIAGVALWTDVLILPFIITGGLLLLVFCWRDLLGWASLFLVLGTLIGVSPMIAYNLTAPPGQDTLTYIRNIQAAEGIKHLSFAELFPLQLQGALFISLPGATGATPLCYNYVGDIQIVQLGGVHQIRCTLMHTGWSIGIVLLWIVAVFFAASAIWRLFRSSAPFASLELRQKLVRYAGRLALLLNAIFVLLPFLFSPAAAYFPVPDMRYLVGMLVTTPALLWPLWVGSSHMKPLLMKLSSAVIAINFTLVKRVILMVVGLVFLIGTLNVFFGAPATSPIPPRQDMFAIVGVYKYLGVPQTRAYNQEEHDLIQNLLRLGTTHIYSDYWTCDRVMFRSQEQIICSAARYLKSKLRTGQNRYPPYCDIVKKDLRAAYVFSVGSPEAAYMERRFRAATNLYDRYSFNGYVVIRPKQALSNDWHCSS